MLRYPPEVSEQLLNDTVGLITDTKRNRRKLLRANSVGGLFVSICFFFFFFFFAMGSLHAGYGSHEMVCKGLVGSWQILTANHLNL